MRKDGGIRAAVAEVVALQLGKSTVGPGDRLIEDLGAESADLVNLAAALDDRFGVFIDEEDLGAVRTVEDLERLVARHRGEP
jgi:acyl carrier protein